MVSSSSLRRGWGLRVLQFVCGLALLLALIPLRDSYAVDPAAEYHEVRQLYFHGQLEKTQQRAERDDRRFASGVPEWGAKFRLIEAEIMVRRGQYDEALRLLAGFSPSPQYPDEIVEQLTIEGAALTREREDVRAGERLARAAALCEDSAYPSCGDALRARGVLAASEGNLSEARQLFLRTVDFAEHHRDRFLEATAALNLGWTALQVEHFDEAVEWSRAAYKISTELHAEDLAENSSGNLGWAYFRLGDTERALHLFLEAEKTATEIGSTREELKWLTTAGYAYEETGDVDRAVSSYHQALDLATQSASKEDIVNILELLAHLSIDTGDVKEANQYVEELNPLVHSLGSRLDDLDVLLAQGKIFAATGQDEQAETAFRTVETDPESQVSMRMGAADEWAKLDERRGDLASASRMYQAALTTFEQARQQLQHEDSKLPFLSNATSIYDDYIRLLVKEGKSDEALAVADHSRARTLAQGLGLASSVQPAALHPGQIAQKADATLLFYWLGHTQSYLWAVTPAQTRLFTLPAQDDITALVDRYRNALLGPDDVLASANEDGMALYRMLVAPAEALIRPGSNVVILSDAVLSQINFETLIVPSPQPHYWIEDATLVSAPSLYMLASAKAAPGTARKALLLGDALSPDPDYPELPNASREMQQIEKHFAAGDQTILARQMATPATYLASDPQQYAYIHFVAHGVASLTDPLDSAIILSRADAADDSFKLYARDIIERPLHARLVTISSCYGGGTRSYAGEGLVGLSWAFLRAGAHNVIGALWEVSDDSTPVLMNSLYQGLQQGLAPSIALRRAKLAMLHERSGFRSPFFWAPFQIYTGL
jgi:CHAT domain-containing protein